LIAIWKFLKIDAISSLSSKNKKAGDIYLALSAFLDNSGG